jgi:hypothetical protein
VASQEEENDLAPQFLNHIDADIGCGNGRW